MLCSLPSVFFRETVPTTQIRNFSVTESNLNIATKARSLICVLLISFGNCGVEFTAN